VQIGHKYYFPDGARAFTDRGRRLTTPSENTEVIRTLVTIAHARGWNDITVSGTERFRKEAWFAARRAGLEVRGYRASELEHEQLARLMSRRGPELEDATKVAEDTSARVSVGAEARASSASGQARVSSRERKGSLIVGRLADHGAATYRHDPHQAMSYFVKLETTRGERTIWGVDLERALRESLTRPQLGDEVGLRAVRQDPVTVKTQERDAQGRVLGRKDLATHRNRWIVEKRAFFEERRAAARALRDPNVEPKRAVQDHPALVGTYLSLHAAELAAKQFRDPRDRERFVSLVRNALADSVARGEPLPTVRLREPAAAGRSSTDQASADRRTPRSARVPERDRAPARS
jgi:putative DNA primase/helicase